MKKLVDMFQDYLSSQSFSYEEYPLMKRTYSDIKDKFSNYKDYIGKVNGKFGEKETVSRILNELNST
jgi:hypothetical protein